MEWLWFIDRGTALVAYPALIVAAFTGLAAAVPAFGALHREAKRHHTLVSVLSGFLLLLHAGFGLGDTVAVAAGKAPVPGYGLGFLLAGAAVGVGAFIVLTVATLAFLDPRRFERPWSPRLVHAFAYAGFALATVHAVAIGTDVAWWMAQAAAALLGILALLALARIASLRRARAPGPTGPAGKAGLATPDPLEKAGPAASAPAGIVPAHDPSP